jgi:site-specific recombinase XerC
MTRLAPLISGFLRDHMPRQRGCSPHSCETYAHSFRLLFAFVAKRTGTKPSQLHVEQLDAALILDFLTHLEQERGNRAVTRNLRLSAIKAFMRYVEYQLPSALEQVAQISSRIERARRAVTETARPPPASSSRVAEACHQ